MPVAAAVVTAAAVTYGTYQQSKAQEEAQDLAEQMYQTDLEAGEYYREISVQQMELQAQSANIQTLADLIAKKNAPKPPQLITTPAPVEYSPVQQINQALAKLFAA